MPTSASNLGRGRKTSLPLCLPSNKPPWRDEGSSVTCQNTTIELIERYVFGIRRGFFISYLFIMSFPFIGLAQVIDFARMESTNHQMLDRVRFFLPLS